MKKEKVIDNLIDLFDQQKMFSGIILNSRDQKVLENTALEITRRIFCINKSAKNDDCTNCRRNSKKTILDILYIGDGNSGIDKKNINSLIDQFSNTAIEENGNKIYILANAENMKESAANALLKFLEEPPHKTYAILLTNDRSEIMSTIKSRCKLFYIDEEFEETEINKLEKILATKNEYTYMLAANIFKKYDRAEFIAILEETYRRTITKQYPKISEPTLKLIEELKFSNTANLSIDNYFIRISEAL
ncbi:DNA polymerase III subunit delta' [Mesoplasma photuris]|uniref:DNA polymerase III subunit delta' n=1 Tax=Mesoplasma photuris TaxID=217731 RepID=UPI0004E0B834|nr:DNA polymerase III subunit delta' [Mesoplasma photuris]